MYLFLDTETGGLDPKKTSLLEITLLIAEGYETIDHIINNNQIITINTKPYDDIFNVHPKALEINRINLITQWLESISYGEAAGLIKSFIYSHTNNKPISVGWNITFDLSFIYEYLFTKESWNVLAHYHNRDLQSIIGFLCDIGKLPLKNPRLIDVARYFGLDTDGAHTSYKDVLLTYQIYQKVKEILL